MNPSLPFSLLHFLSFCLVVSVPFVRPVHALHVVVDAGHGGKDLGAHHSHAQESKITLEVAKKLALKLQQDPRFKVTLTRQNDEFLTLMERARVAYEAEADVLVSIHANSSPDPKAQGAEFYFRIN